MPGPYAQLAGTYRAVGHDGEARNVLVASQNARFKQDRYHLPAKTAARLFRWTVGYGYRPWLALPWFVGLVVLATLAVWALPAGEFAATGHLGAPNPLLYSLETALPAVSLGVVSATPVGAWAETVTVALRIGGWLLIAAVLAGVASVLRRGD